MEATVYNIKGAETGKVTLPESVFGQKWNADLVHEVVVSMMSNARANTAHTKDRSEVRGGGRKPWRQKGTGRARHGSRRSPIWRTGGVTFGPRNERNFSKKINKKIKAKALGMVLSKKFEDGEIIFVDTISLSAPKTAEAKGMLKALSKVKGAESLANKKKNAALVVLAARDENTEKSFRNFGNVLLQHAKDMNTIELLSYKYVLISDPEAVIETMKARVGDSKKTAPKAVAPVRTGGKKPAAKSATKVAAVKNAPAKKLVAKKAASVKKASAPVRAMPVHAGGGKKTIVKK